MPRQPAALAERPASAATVIRPAPTGPPRHGARVRWEAVGWSACAVFALGLSLVTTLTPHRVWGACAAAGYAVAAVSAWRAPRPWGRASRIAAFAGAVLVPMVLLVMSNGAQSEVGVVERSGVSLLTTGSPYSPHPLAVQDYDPYLPGMALFGIPRALLSGTPLGDARVWFAAVFLVCLLVARPRPGTTRTAAALPLPPACPLLLAAFPAVALPLAVGGVDLPVIGLMCLALALAGRGGSGVAAGAAMGAAAALKWTAWPLLPVGVALIAATAGRRAAVRATVTGLLVTAVAVVPAVLTGPRAFVEHVVLFPLGEAGTRSPAASPLPGYLLAHHVPGGFALAVLGLAGGAVAMAVSLVVRTPGSAVAAADRLAVGLGLAMCLMPATRFGYLVYPLVLAMWFRQGEWRRPRPGVRVRRVPR